MKASIFQITIFSILAVLSLGQAAQATQKLGEVHDREFAILEGDKALHCSRSDENNDGTKETTVVWVSLGHITMEAPGLLQNPYIENKFNDPDGKICADVKKIIDSLPMTFMAVYGTFDSSLALKDKTLVENVSITLKESVWQATQTPVTLTLKTTVEKTLD
jgi:hypothetical protein